MIDRITIQLEFSNSQLSTDDLVQFEREANSLLIDHILDPFVDGTSLDLQSIYRDIHIVNLEEIPIDGEVEPNIDIDEDKLDSDATINIIKSQPLQISCNFEQYKVLQYYVITNFPTYSYEDSQVNPAELSSKSLYRQPVSIIPRFQIVSIELDTTYPEIKEYQSCGGSVTISVPKHLPINKESLELYLIEYLKQHLKTCHNVHPKVTEKIEETNIKIDPLYFEEFSISPP